MSDAQLEKLQENLLAAIASTTAKIDTTNTKIETLQTTLNNEIDSIRSEHLKMKSNQQTSRKSLKKCRSKSNYSNKTDFEIICE